MTGEQNKPPSDDPQVAESGAAGPDDAAAVGEDRSGFLGRVQSAWHQTVGEYATEEAHARNLFQRLVEFGNITGEEAKKLLADTNGRIEENRNELENRVEESFKRATARWTVPSPDEVEDLEKKIESLEQRIQSLEQGG